jgi:hypothetical protein
MKFMLMIHQGDTPTPRDPDAWAQLPAKTRLLDMPLRWRDEMDRSPGQRLRHTEFAPQCSG